MQNCQGTQKREDSPACWDKMNKNSRSSLPFLWPPFVVFLQARVMTLLKYSSEYFEWFVSLQYLDSWSSEAFTPDRIYILEDEAWFQGWDKCVSIIYLGALQLVKTTLSEREFRNFRCLLFFYFWLQWITVSDSRLMTVKIGLGDFDILSLWLKNLLCLSLCMYYTHGKYTK